MYITNLTEHYLSMSDYLYEAKAFEERKMKEAALHQYELALIELDKAVDFVCSDELAFRRLSELEKRMPAKLLKLYKFCREKTKILSKELLFRGEKEI